MRAALAAVLTLALVLAGVTEALAHATLLRSEPADGALVATAPERYELTFDEPVTPLVLLIVDPSGDTRALSEVDARDNRLTIRMPPDLANGTHVLSWRVVSADGHPIGGSLMLSVGRASAGPQSAGRIERVASATAMALWLARLLMLVGLLVGVGGVIVACRCVVDAPAPAPLPEVLDGTLAAGLCAALLSIGLQGLDAHGRGLGDLLEPAMWRTGLSTSHGVAALFAALAMSVAVIARRAPLARPAVACSSFALVGAALALATSGHASTAPPKLVMSTLVALHAVALVLWIGALVPLAVLLQRNGEAALDLLMRFQRLGWPVVVTIGLTGAVLAVVQVGRFSALWSTEYGLLLLVKLVLVAAMLGLAAFNRWRLTPRIMAGDTDARQIMQGVVTTEMLLAGLVIAIAAGWRLTPPPRVLALQPVPQFQIHLHGTTAMANVVLTPARAGPVRAVIHPRTIDLRPLDVKEVEMAIISTTAGIQPIRRGAVLTGPQTWTIEQLTIPGPGLWRVEVVMLITDFERARLEARIAVRR